MNNFEKEIREKMYHYAVPEETGNWDALALRMARRAALRRRSRWALSASAVAAVFVVPVLFMPFTGRLSVPPVQTCTIFRHLQE